MLFGPDGKAWGVRAGNEVCSVHLVTVWLWPLNVNLQVAKGTLIIGDPSYFPRDKCRVRGRVIRSICILDHPIAGTEQWTCRLTFYEVPHLWLWWRCGGRGVSANHHPFFAGTLFSLSLISSPVGWLISRLFIVVTDSWSPQRHLCGSGVPRSHGIRCWKVYCNSFDDRWNCQSRGWGGSRNPVVGSSSRKVFWQVWR